MPSLAELMGTVEAVLDAQLKDHTSDGATAELAELSFKTRKIPKRQAFGASDVLQATMQGGDSVFGRIFEIAIPCASIGTLVNEIIHSSRPPTRCR